MATYKVKTNGKEYSVSVVDTPGGGATVSVEGRSFEVEAVGLPPAPALQPSAAAAPAPTAAAPTAASPAAPKVAAPTGSGAVVAPIPGVVTQILVKVGDTVSAGQTVLRLEAMKMENDIASAVAGTVKEISVAEGAEVSDGQSLLTIG